MNEEAVIPEADLLYERSGLDNSDSHTDNLSSEAIRMLDAGSTVIGKLTSSEPRPLDVHASMSLLKLMSMFVSHNDRPAQVLVAEPRARASRLLHAHHYTGISQFC